MNRTETAQLVTTIYAHHHAQASEVDVNQFFNELDPDMSIRDAMEAVRCFYAENTTGRWMGSGDVNAAVRRMIRKRIPDDATITRLIIKYDIPSERQLEFVRRLVRQSAKGISFDAAVSSAVKVIEAKEGDR